MEVVKATCKCAVGAVAQSVHYGRGSAGLTGEGSNMGLCAAPSSAAKAGFTKLLAWSCCAWALMLYTGEGASSSPDVTLRGVSRPPLVPLPATVDVAAAVTRRLKANHTKRVRSAAAAAQPTAMPAISPPLSAGSPSLLLLLLVASAPVVLAGESAAAAEPASEVAGAAGAASGCCACCACCGSGAGPGTGATGADRSSALPSWEQFNRDAWRSVGGTLLPASRHASRRFHNQAPRATSCAILTPRAMASLPPVWPVSPG